MTLKLYNYTKDAKSGKLKRTGTTSTIGNVSRGSAGGYTKGVIDGLAPTSQKSLSGPVYAPPSTASMVPNSPGVQQPNTSTPNGPVFTPPPGAPQGAPQSPQAVPSPAAPVSTSSTAQGPQEASNPAPGQPGAAPKTRTVQVAGSDGQVVTYHIDDNYSFKDQTGRFEFPFFTAEGQKERLRNALETASIRASPTQFGSSNEAPPVVGTATTVAIDALNVAALLNAGQAVFKALQTSAKVGATAAAIGGEQAIAAASPAAIPVAASAPIAAGQVASNTKNVATSVKFLKGLTKVKSLVTLGGLVTVLGSSSSQRSGVKEEVVNFAKDSGDLQLELAKAGMTDMAEELYQTNVELEEALDELSFYIPYFGTNAVKDRITAAKDEYNRANREYEQYVEQQKVDKINAALEAEAQQKAAQEATQREQQIVDREDQRAYNEQQQQEQRAYNEQQKQEQRAYNEGQTQRLLEAQAKAEATATQSSEGSTLQFGLLGSGGATEFVDRDKASKVYFGKVYDELTPEQKMLLNLLKGGQ